VSELHWLDRRIVFFGGKGGVGKTTCAAAFALLASQAGRRTLLVSTDPAHSTGDILQADLGPTERRLTEHLWALEIDSEREAAEYIETVRTHLLRSTPEHLRAEMERQVEIAKVSPGAEEAALFDRVAELVLAARERFELVVFDTAPTGHTLRLLTLPELLQAWIDGLLDRRRRVNQLSALWRHMTVSGSPDEEVTDPVERVLVARRRKFYQMRELLLSPGMTTFIFVILAERLPILETAKAVAMLRRFQVPVGGLVVNRILPEDAAGHPFLAARKDQERRYLVEIAATFPDLPRLELPLLPHDVVGLEALQEIVEHLGRAMGSELSA
jgi:arsenite/tail-anchored protein-transporting ATPase